MANVAVITNAGLAVANAAQPTGPFLDIRYFRVRDTGTDGPVSPSPAPPYTPLPGDTSGVGTLKIPLTPINNYRVVNDTTTAYRCQMDATVGPFLFNVVELYLADGTTVFAIAVLDGKRRQKAKTTGSDTGNTYIIEFLVTLGANGVSTITFQSITEQAASVPVVALTDLVPTASIAAATLYQTSVNDRFGKVISARRKGLDLWDVDRAALVIGRDAPAIITGASANSITSPDIADRLSNFQSDTFILHITSGAQKGTLRMLTSAGLNTAGWFTGYPSPASLVGATFEILELQNPANLQAVSAVERSAAEFRFDSVDLAGIDRGDAFNVAQSLNFSGILRGKGWTQFATKKDWVPVLPIRVDLLYVLDGVDVGTNVELVLNVWRFGHGDTPSLGSPDAMQVVNIVSTANNTSQATLLSFTLLSSFQEGDFISLSLLRDGEDPADSYQGVFKLLNMSFYQDT